eukprot:4642118-Amphidinium_carterae.1
MVRGYKNKRRIKRFKCTYDHQKLYIVTRAYKPSSNGVKPSESEEGPKMSETIKETERVETNKGVLVKTNQQHC